MRKLEAAGLVVRHPSSTDGRVTIVELSDRGQQLLPRLTTAWQQLAERTVAQLDDEPLEPLVHTLTELARSLTATSAPATESPRYPATAPDTGDRETIPLPGPTVGRLRSCVAALLVLQLHLV